MHLGVILKQEEPLFSNITDIPPDSIFGINDLYLKDPRKDKINLTIGILVTEDGKVAPILESVKLAEKAITEKQITKNYLAIDGDESYISETKKIVFGETDYTKIYGAQTIGGTSAISILAEFLMKEVSSFISIPNPTWENHENIFKRFDFHVDKYPYPEGMFEHLANLNDGSIVLMHAVCHNPTGLDLSEDDILKLRELCIQKKLIPFFDNAYQGFKDGLDNDAFMIRKFLEKDMSFVVAHSYSKSFSLYGERVGALFVKMKDKTLHDKIKRNIRSLIRTNYSNPPRHGAMIVAEILKDQKLRTLWESELAFARERMNLMRMHFYQKLKEKIPEKPFDELRNGGGFFALLGLDDEASKRLKDEFSIYLAPKSRVNLTAINGRNIDRIVDAIRQVL
jgi:aspartate/tyrosine/aromatic aminotransferase